MLDRRWRLQSPAVAKSNDVFAARRGEKYRLDASVSRSVVSRAASRTMMLLARSYDRSFDRSIERYEETRNLRNDRRSTNESAIALEVRLHACSRTVAISLFVAKVFTIKIVTIREEEAERH
jgi:hypothetical protein